MRRTRCVTILGPFTAGFFNAYEASGWKVPLTGRIDFPAALAAVSPQFRDSGALSDMTGVTVFTPVQEHPEYRISSPPIARIMD